MGEMVILGAGVMGSAMAVPAAACGHRVKLVGTHLDEEIVRSVAGNGFHQRLQITLPSAVSAHRHVDFAATLGPDTDVILLGVASAGVDWAIERLAEALPRPIPVLMITKGLSTDGEEIRVLPHIVRERLRSARGFDVPVMAIGGPCIAGELAAERDTSVVITGNDTDLLERTLGFLGAPFYHARPSDDVIGVEVCAAFKNFYAIGVGWSTGHLERYGKASNGAMMHNLTSGLFNQALLELNILVSALGGTSASVYGLPGVGDLYVTCQAGRNSRMGRLLGLGLTYSDAKANHMAQDTVEGAELARTMGPTLDRMFERGRLDAARMPLTRAVVDSVYRNQPFEFDWQRFYR
jgi:glycerol-3-phosphate dehydrogenase (NAD(P)+)